MWLLIGIFAFHGLAEELVWRGFAFRRLREGRSFRSALGWTMPLIAITHLPIVFTLGPVIGLTAMLIAAVTSIPFGYLYESGRHTIWAPALLHTAIDAFKLVIIPAGALAAFSPLILVTALLVPLLVMVVPWRLLTGRDAGTRWSGRVRAALTPETRPCKSPERTLTARAVLCEPGLINTSRNR